MSPSEATAIQRNPLAQDSWLDLPNVEEDDNQNNSEAFEPKPTQRTEPPPSAQSKPKSSILPDSFSPAQEDGPTKLTSSPFAEAEKEEEEALGVQRRPLGKLKLTPEASQPLEDTGSPSMEFLLRDRLKQRQELWYTLIPLTLRMLVLVGFVVLFAWLWTSLDRGSFASSNLGWAPISQTFFGEHSPWKFRTVRQQWRRVGKRPVLVLRGTLEHNSKKPQQQPRIVITYNEKGKAKRSPLMACCAVAKASHLKALHSVSSVRQWQRAPSSKRVTTLSANKAVPFTLLWLPPKGIQSFKLRVVPSKARPPQRRRPVERDEFDSDDDDDDDD